MPRVCGEAFAGRREMFFAYDERQTEYLKSRDAKLGAVIDRLGHIDRTVDPDLFQAVVRHIVGQQISMKAQKTVWDRLRAKLGEVTPQSVGLADVEGLRSVGISGRKAEYIKDFCDRIRRGDFDLGAVERMDDKEAIRALSSLKGIGVWTAEMILLFCLQRPDVLSFDDLAIQRGMRMVYRHRTIDRERFERYRRRLSPCSSVASLYFWAVSGGALAGVTDPAAVRKKK